MKFANGDAIARHSSSPTPSAPSRASSRCWEGRGARGVESGIALAGSAPRRGVGARLHRGRDRRGADQITASSSPASRWRGRFSPPLGGASGSTRARCS